MAPDFGYFASIELARRGHKVYATCLYDEQIKKLNTYAKENSLDIDSFKLDIRNENDLKKLENIEFDTLINNAAIGDSGSILEVDIAKIKNVYETNVFATINITQIVAKKFIKQGYGKIIFLSSLFGKKSMAFLAPYTMTKFSIEALCESLKIEVKKLHSANIKIKVITPGAYATGFNMENTVKKYEWMKEKSYFKDELNKIEETEKKTWNLIEFKSFKSIIKKYVKAVESNTSRYRYSAPFIEVLLIKLATIFS